MRMTIVLTTASASAALSHALQHDARVQRASRSSGCVTWQAAKVGRQLGLSPATNQEEQCIWLTFRRFNASEAREILSGSHLLLIGDSVTQYWYTSLAYWLHFGDDLKAWNETDKGHAHPLYELWWSQLNVHTNRSWWAWNAYYNGTSADFLGAEICDCWRESCHPRCSPQSYSGNRYFNFTSGSGIIGRLSLIMSLGTTVRPRWHDLDERGWRLRCGADHGARTNRCLGGAPTAHDLSKTTPAEMLDALIRHFAPTDVVVHMKTNWRDEGFEKAGSSTCKFARSFDLDTGGHTSLQPRILWNDLDTSKWAASATTIANGSRAAQCIDSPKASHKVNAQLLTLVPPLVARLLLKLPRSDVFIDAAHFQPWVYHEINQLLLNVLLDPRGGSSIAQ
jgi:hypothetical protein